MAVRRSAESCIMCAPDPCTCSTSVAAKPKKLAIPAAKSPPQSRPVKPEATEPQFDPTAQATPPQPRKTTISGIAKRGPSQEALEERRALTVLCQSGLVRWEDIESLRGMLDMTAPQIDALIWRTRRLTWIQKPR